MLGCYRLLTMHLVPGCRAAFRASTTSAALLLTVSWEAACQAACSALMLSSSGNGLSLSSSSPSSVPCHTLGTVINRTVDYVRRCRLPASLDAHNSGNAFSLSSSSPSAVSCHAANTGMTAHLYEVGIMAVACHLAAVAIASLCPHAHLLWCPVTDHKQPMTKPPPHRTACWMLNSGSHDLIFPIKLT